MRTIYMTVMVLFLLAHSASGSDSITFTNENLTLEGTLTLPPDTDNPPAVVLIHGSGPSDRDLTSPLLDANSRCIYPDLYEETLRPFKDLAELLADNGIATLRYDKRTYTYGTELDLKTILPDDFIADAVSAVDYLKSREDIDTNNIFVLGISQGANFVPLISNERPAIRGHIAMATPAKPIDSILALQVRDIHYMCGDSTQGDTEYQLIIDIMQDIREETYDDNSPVMGAYPAFWRSWMKLTDTTVKDFLSVQQPGLILQGGEDFNVKPDNYSMLKAALPPASYGFSLFNELNHFFTPDDIPAVPAYVADTIAEWINSNSITEEPNYLPELNNDSGGLQLKLRNKGKYVFITEPQGIQWFNVYTFNGREVYSSTPENGKSRITKSALPLSPAYIILAKTDEGYVSDRFYIEH